MSVTAVSKPNETVVADLNGPAGRLQALYEVPADAPPRGGALVMHPHPRHGGTMHNKVVHTLARAFTLSGFATLRFNFRGTGDSAGSYDGGAGELDDALAATEWLQVQLPAAPLWLGGFSFGAAIALRAALETRTAGLVTVAPAARRFASGLPSEPVCPWLIVQGDEDELVPVEETIDWVNGLAPGPELMVMEGAEHFFHGRLVELREAVMRFIEAHA